MLYGPITHHFQDKQRFQSKITISFPPHVFCAPAEGVHLAIGYRHFRTKTRMMELPGQERSLMISLAIWIQYTMDSRMDMGNSKDPAYA